MHVFRVWLAVVFLLAMRVNGSVINWVTDTGNNAGRLLKAHDNATLIRGSRADPAVGGFLQLIYLGPDGQFNSANRDDWNAVGVVGDDQVVDASWVGAGRPAPLVAGACNASWVNTTIDSGAFLIRFFERPAPSFNTTERALSTVPSGGNWGHSGVFANTVPASSPSPENFAIPGYLYANASEPASMFVIH